MSVSIPTDAEIELMNMSQLVKVHNELAPRVDAASVPVKKFATRDVGIKRVTKLIAALRTLVAKAAELRKAPEPVPSIVKLSKAVNGKTPRAQTQARAKALNGETVPPTEGDAVEPRGKPAAGSKPSKPATMASRIRELILAGKTNEEVWAVVNPEFSMGDGKKWHVTWYRGDMKRKGVL